MLHSLIMIVFIPYLFCKNSYILKCHIHFQKVNLFVFCLRWVFVAARWLCLVEASRGYSSSRCAGFSLWWLVLVAEQRLQVCGLQQLCHKGSVVVARGLQSAGSVVVAHGLTCSAACGIFQEPGSNPCVLHWQVDS